MEEVLITNAYYFLPGNGNLYKLKYFLNWRKNINTKK